MKTTSVQKRNLYFAIGAFGLLFTAGYLGLSLQLPFGRLDETGAAVFPVFVSIIMMLASLATLWEAWRLDKAVRIDLPAGAGGKRVLSLVAFLLGYFLLLPWLGQLICSTLFCILLMRVMSELSWPRIVLYSLAISLVLYISFIHFLKVPMPQGILIF